MMVWGLICVMILGLAAMGCGTDKPEKKGPGATKGATTKPAKALPGTTESAPGKGV
jgi:hypothetical protein